MSIINKIKRFWKIHKGICPECGHKLDYRGWYQDRPFCLNCKWEGSK